MTVHYRLAGKKDSSVANAQLEYNEKTGYFEGTVFTSGCDETGSAIGYYGIHELDYISAFDYYGNCTFLSGLDVAEGNFEIEGGNPDDNTPPVIDYDNIVMEKVVNKGEKVKIKIPVIDDSPIYAIGLSYRGEKGNDVWATLDYKGNSIYQAELDFEYEDIYHVGYIYIRDANYNGIFCYANRSLWVVAYKGYYCYGYSWGSCEI